MHPTLMGRLPISLLKDWADLHMRTFFIMKSMYIKFSLNRGSNMSALFIIEFIKSDEKKDQMRGLLSI